MKKANLSIFLVSIFLVTFLVKSALAVEFFLRADKTVKRVPGADEPIPMWGFALDSSFGAEDGEVSVPGPRLYLPPGDNNLIIHLDNNLPVPVSLVIPGQITEMHPTFVDGRVMSFTYETPPGNDQPVDYVWNDFKNGAFIYQSGTNPAVQIQMGLYGVVVSDAGQNNVYGVDDSSFDKEITLVFSEIDPEFNKAVANNQYGPGKKIESAIDFDPKFFLINGEPFSPSNISLGSVTQGEKVLVRLLNAGLVTHVPLFYGTYVRLIAEDGNLLPHPLMQYSVVLQAGKRRDVVLSPPDIDLISIMDRRLNLTNWKEAPGGMLRMFSVKRPGVWNSPKGQFVFTPSAPVLPITKSTPRSSVPIGLGLAATGTPRLTLSVASNGFDAPVDCFLAFRLGQDPSNIWLLGRDNKLVNADQGLIPWKENVTSAIEEIPLKDISLEGLGPGTIDFYLLITPHGSLSDYYLWKETLNI